MITILLWKWKQEGFRESYTADHVNTMVAMLRRNLSNTNHRIICVTDDPKGVNCETYELWNDYSTLRNASGAHLPSCYRRLKMFDFNTLQDMGIAKGTRVISIDLDAVIVGSMSEIFDRKEKFVGWAVRGMFHPRVFNGSFIMFNCGDYQDIWSEFDPINSPKIAHAAGYFGSDQGWLSYKLRGKELKECGGWSWPQLASWPREIRRIGKVDIRNRVVFFHGRHKPWHPDTLRVSPWIKRYWHQEVLVK